MFLKSEVRNNAEGLPDLLLYDSLLKGDVLALQDGGLQRTWQYTPPDTSTWPLLSGATKSLQALSHSVAGGMCLGSGWMVETNAMRRPVSYYPPTVETAPPVVRLIDEERRRQFLADNAVFETSTYLTLTYLPPMLREERASRWITGRRDKKNPTVDELTAQGTRNYETFVQHCDAFAAALGGDLEQLGPLTDVHGDQQVLRYIRECIQGEDHPFAAPDVPLDLHMLFGVDAIPGEQPIIDRRPVRVIAIDTFPAHSLSAVYLWRALEDLPFSFRYHTRLILFDPDVSMKLHDRYRRIWRVQQRGLLSQMLNIRTENANSDLDEMEAEAKKALSVASRGLVQFGAVNVKLILYGEQLEPNVLQAIREQRTGPAIQPYVDTLQVLQERTKAITQLAKKCGYGVRVETRNAMDALRASWPGHGYSDIRMFPLHTRNVADSMPLHLPFRGEDTNPAQYMPPNTPPLLVATSPGGTLKKLHPHNGDVPHALLVGPTRMGKSILVATLSAQWLARYPEGRVFLFDKRASCRTLCEACGGVYYPLGGGEKNAPRLAPFENLATPDDLAWAEWYLVRLFEINGKALTPAQRKRVSEVLLAAQQRPPGRRSLTDIQALFGDDDISKALHYWTCASVASNGLLDGVTDQLAIEDRTFCIFEMQHLLEMDERVRKAVIPYLFRVITRQLRSDQPTLIGVDEVWSALLDRSFEDTLRSWLKELAKLNGCLVLSTQNLDDFFNSPLRNIILDQCMTRYYLPNSNAVSLEGGRLYTEMGLTDEQRAAIAGAEKQRDYFRQSIGTSQTFSKMELRLGEVARAFMGRNSEPDQRRWRELYREDPDRAAAAWLTEHDLGSWTPYLWQLEQEETKHMLEAIA